MSKYDILGERIHIEAKALLTQRPDDEFIVVEDDAITLKLAFTYLNLSAL